MFGALTVNGVYIFLMVGLIYIIDVDLSIRRSILSVQTLRLSPVRL